MRYVVVTAHTLDEPYQRLAQRTYPTLEAYAKRHGYALLYEPAVPTELGAYGKLQAILDTFDTLDADIALWVDTDAFITNPDVKIEELITVPAAITLTADCLGTNTGVMIVQDGPLLRQFFWACLGWGRMTYGIVGWAEQTAIREIAKTHPYNQPGFIRHIEQRLMNSYPAYNDGRVESFSQWEPGDFILHMPGMGMEQRHSILDQWEAMQKGKVDEQESSGLRGSASEDSQIGRREQGCSRGNPCFGQSQGECQCQTSEPEIEKSTREIAFVGWYQPSIAGYPCQIQIVKVRFAAGDREEFAYRLGDEWKSADGGYTFGGVAAWRHLTTDEHLQATR